MRIRHSALVCLGFFLWTVPLSAGELLPIAVAVAEGRATCCSVSRSGFQAGSKYLPIGVFDSGVGGLTVLRSILTLDRFDNRTGEPGSDGRPDFEAERFIYLGDQANMPYGNYPAEDGVDFLRELVVKDGAFLLGSRYWPGAETEEPALDKVPVKAIVIACNTATAYGLEDLRAAVELWEVPVAVIGVVEAGARGAVQEGRGPALAVGVLATRGTCASQGYVKAIEKVCRERGLPVPAVVQQGCLGLAGAVEGEASYIDPDGGGVEREVDYRGPAVGSKDAPIDTALVPFYGFDPDGILGWGREPGLWQLNSVENYIRYHCLGLVENYRRTRGPGAGPIGTVILGCTHFPFYRQEFISALERLRTITAPDGGEPYGELLAGEIEIIDPALLTAGELYRTLKDQDLLLAAGEESIISTHEFYISVPNRSLGEAELTAGGTFTYAYKYGRKPGRAGVEYVRRVPMSAASLSAAAVETVRKSMPGVWLHLVEFNRRSPRCVTLPDPLRFN
ncbi:MAG: aspartate/glutamate racemase family protein [Gemmatimonadota bacterium]|nr:aspartate/glutamate racemase family protein [Gemmatimonadota bacterium]